MNLSSAARIAQSSLGTISGEMALVSRNIAGSTADFSSRKAANAVSTGSGVKLGPVTRASNLAVFANLLTSTANKAAKTTLSAGLEQLAATLGDLSTGTDSPADAISNFTNALRAYASTPGDSIAAGTAVSSAETLVKTLNSASTVVQGVRAQADSDMAQSVQTINSLLDQFQAVNEKVVEGTATGTDVTDAQDQRDAIAAKLSNEIGITTTTSANGDMAIYTDSGVTLFQGGRARSVAFTPTDTYTSSVNGNPVFVDGVPVTGTSAPMAIASGKLAAAATLRDGIAVSYQAQLDNIAGALIGEFAESDQVGSGANLPGLFTTPGATALPTTILGLAASISVNPNVDPAQGGDPNLLRDGGISAPGNPNYTYNTNNQASFTDRINQLLGNLSSAYSFAPQGGLYTSASVDNYAAASASWLSAERGQVASDEAYQGVLSSTASSALSNTTGVDIDSEMSKMLTLEQSYSATAKLMTTIDSMFSALIQSI